MKVRIRQKDIAAAMEVSEKYISVVLNKSETGMSWKRAKQAEALTGIDARLWADGDGVKIKERLKCVDALIVQEKEGDNNEYRKG
jgi:hypothetical protein